MNRRSEIINPSDKEGSGSWQALVQPFHSISIPVHETHYVPQHKSKADIGLPNDHSLDSYLFPLTIRFKVDFLPVHTPHIWVKERILLFSDASNWHVCFLDSLSVFDHRFMQRLRLPSSPSCS